MRFIAERLGLELVSGEIRGVLEGQTVRAGFEYGSSPQYGAARRAISHVSPPLDLGLLVRTKQLDFDDRPELRVPGRDELVGKADEPARYDALLASAELRAAFADASRDWLLLDDRRCEIREGPDDSWFESAIRRAARLTRALSEAAVRVPVAAPLTAHRAFFREYAEAHGFAGTDTPLRMWGPVAGGGVALAMTRVGALSFRLELRLAFAPPLALGLSLRRESFTTRLRNLVSPDVELGDWNFDRAFQIRAGADVSRVLDDEVRAAFVELEPRLGKLVVDDSAIALESREVPPTPEEIAWILERVRRLARRMVENATGSAAGGTPYR